jgi:hypothetical protein
MQFNPKIALDYDNQRADIFSIALDKYRRRGAEEKKHEIIREAGLYKSPNAQSLRAVVIINILLCLASHD